MSEPVPVRKRIEWTSRARLFGLIAVALAVAVVIPQLIVRSRDDEADQALPSSPSNQRVVAWTLHEEGRGTYLAVFGSGAKEAVVLAIPAEVTINVPGQNLGTPADAAAAGDQDLVEVTVENLLGVPIDETVLADVASLTTVVDGMGGISVRGEDLSGAEVAAYLREIPEDAPPDLAFLRWQDVLDGLIAVGPDKPAALPEQLRPVLTEAPSLVSLPVVDIGGGLLRPDQEALQPLVAEHFVLTTPNVVRLVVLNGVGTPGIGEEVARILVPEGFRLMSSGNANTFDLEMTTIIASSREDLDAAARAKDLLGAGEVQLGNQPTGLADVTVVVGRDFGGS